MKNVQQRDGYLLNKLLLDVGFTQRDRTADEYAAMVNRRGSVRDDTALV